LKPIVKTNVLYNEGIFCKVAHILVMPHLIELYSINDANILSFNIYLTIIKKNQKNKKLLR